VRLRSDVRRIGVFLAVVIHAVSMAGGCDRAASTTAAGGDAPADAKPNPTAVAGAKEDPKAAAAPKAGLPSATELLDKAVEAQGGRAKLDDLDSFYLEGELVVQGQNITGAMKLWWKAGDFYTEQNMVGIGTVRAGKQGDVIWSEDPISGLRRLTGAEAAQQAWASSPSLAAHWQRYFEKAETIGEREVGGKKAYDVQLVAKDGATVTLTFDAESGLQLAQSFDQVTPMGKMPISVELKDYREVGGLKLPYLQVTDAKLAKATQTLTKIELGAVVDTAKFAMPTGGAAVVKAEGAADGGAAAAAVP
jgi:hypothetical protein